MSYAENNVHTGSSPQDHQLSGHVYFIDKQSYFETHEVGSGTVYNDGGSSLPDIRIQPSDPDASVRRVPAAQVFTEFDTLTIANDVGVLPARPRAEKVWAETILTELLQAPDTATTLSAGMALETDLRRTMLGPDDLARLGYIAPEELTGSPNIPDSNSWKVAALLERAHTEPGARLTNSLHIPALRTVDAVCMPAATAADVQDAFYRAGRSMLDTLYEQYSVELDLAVVVKHASEGDVTRTETVYPIAGTGAYFNEITSIYRDKNGDSPPRQYLDATIDYFGGNPLNALLK